MTTAELNHYLLVLKLSQSSLRALTGLDTSTVNRMCRGLTPVNVMVARLVRFWVTYPQALAWWKGMVDTGL